MRFLVLLVAAAAFASLSSSHAATPDELPELGDASSAIVSPAEERRLGQMFLKQVRSGVPTVQDEILKYYVATQLQQLAQHSDLKDAALYPVLIDNPEINAFAVPGGVVGVHLGLLVHARDVHEYSAVMAHELAHLSQRHFARDIEAQRQSTLPMLVGLLAGAVLMAAGGGGDAGLATMVGTQAAAVQNQLRYSRSREQEADRIGLNTMVRAELDPHGLERMFGRMQRAYRFRETMPEFLLTHPVTESRIADARNQAAQYPDRSVAGSRDYQFMRARTLVHFARSPEDALARARDDDVSGAARGYRLALARSGASEHLEAVLDMKRLLDANPGSILLAASYGETLTAAGRAEEAAGFLAHQLVINPDNQPLAMLYAKALSSVGRQGDAKEVLIRQSRVHGDDIDVWHELAETAGLAGDIVGVHRARAEFFALRGDYRQAIQHLEYARRLVEDNYRLTEGFTQRILDLRTELESLKG
ncbi:MAG: M48 family metalloprotease [Gammaproteobacteria bacterium]|nr:M48 family metalloprotease [Gammaproteobacteria bacterium]